MKLMLGTIAGVLAAAALTPVPAEAQRWHDSRGWHEGRYQHRGRWYDPPRGYYRQGYWNSRGWQRQPRVRTVCRWERGRWGRQEVCRPVRVR